MARPLPLLLTLALLLGLPQTLWATNTDKRVSFRVTLHSGKVLKGRLKWGKTKLSVGRRKVRYLEVASIAMPAQPSRKTLLAGYEQRKQATPKGDAKAWLRLGRWARRNHLDAEARLAFQSAALLDPSSKEAQRGAGRIQQGGAWVEGKPLLLERIKALKPGDLDGKTTLAKLALDHGLRPQGARLLVEVLLANIYHKRALRLLKPFTKAYRQRTKPLIFPLSGRWRASTDPTRHHQKKSYAVYALDLTKVDAAGRAYRGQGKRLKDWYTWGAPFYAVAAGTVVEVRDGNPDNPVGKGQGMAEKHNGVAIDHGQGEFSWYVHAKRGSIKVKQGQRVQAGQVLGEVGNSGGSYSPHLHFTLGAWRGISVPWHCTNYEVIAPDGTPIRVTEAWPREGWTIKAPPPQAGQPKTGQPQTGQPKTGQPKTGQPKTGSKQLPSKAGERKPAPNQAPAKPKRDPRQG